MDYLETEFEEKGTSEEQEIWLQMLVSFIHDLKYIDTRLKRNLNPDRRLELLEKRRQILMQISTEWCESVCDMAGINYDFYLGIINKMFYKH